MEAFTFQMANVVVLLLFSIVVETAIDISYSNIAFFQVFLSKNHNNFISSRLVP